LTGAQIFSLVYAFSQASDRTARKDRRTLLGLSTRRPTGGDVSEFLAKYVSAIGKRFFLDFVDVLPRKKSIE